MDRPGATDVVVVGGGVIGLAVAWRAAQAGLTVTICDPEPGGAASWVAAGMLAPVTEASIAEAPLTTLGLASARRWPTFAAELAEAGGIDPGLRQDGTLAVAFDDDDRRALDELLRVHRALGLKSEWLTPTQCRRLEPRISPRIRGALRVDGDWQVNNRALIPALLTAATRAGVIVRRTSVRRLCLNGDSDSDCDGGGVGGDGGGVGGGGGGGAVSGVELEGGDTIVAPQVVVAAGCWSPVLAGLPAAARPPVRPVKGEILRLAGDPADPILDRTVRASVAGRSVYLVPRRHGEVVVGATMQEAGFDTSVRAGAVYELLQAAVELVPGVADLELVESRAGLRPATPDNAPVLGRTPIQGLVLATGHYRNGILLTPLTADAVTAVLVGGDLPAVAAPFTLNRFTSSGLA